MGRTKGGGFGPWTLTFLVVANMVGAGVFTTSGFTLASLRGFRAGSVCTVFAERARDRFVSADEKTGLEDRVVEVGLRALRTLAE